MKRRLTAAAAIILFAIDQSRFMYPYAGLSVADEAKISQSVDIIIPKDMTLDRVITLTDTIVTGEFINDNSKNANKFKGNIPDKNTAEYASLKSQADRFHKSVESFANNIATYGLYFKVDEVISSKGDVKSHDIIRLRTGSLCFINNTKVYPEVQKGSKAVLFLMHRSHEVNNIDYYISGSYGFFYVNRFNYVLSAEAYHSLDCYTGTGLSDFIRTIKKLTAEG